jgi:hypothetical protein
VFISYSHVNANIAKSAVRALEREGAEVWIDEKAMPYGAHISESCKMAIRRSNKVLLLVTPESIRSEWVRQELEMAL